MKKKAAPETPRRFDVFLPFAKVEEIDGAVYVSSRATREELDKQKEIVGIEASVKAFTESAEWFERVTGGKSKGNVREMHRASAAGKMLAWYHDAEDDAIDVDLKVVDADAGKKCREAVYVGVSIGGIPKAWETVEVDGKKVRKITEYDLVEISLVDRPACPSAVFSVVKRADVPPVPVPVVEKAEKEPTTVQTLIFDKEKFSVDEAKAWAEKNGFKSSKVDEPEAGDTIRLRQRDPVDFKDDMRTITLKPGVKAVVGHLKLATPRFGKVLGDAEETFEKRMQGMVLFPAMDALRNLQYALESLGYDAQAGEEVQGDLATLTSAVDAILEFMATKFADQLRTATSEKSAVRSEIADWIDRVETLPRVLNPFQLQKVMEDGEMKDNLDAIHTMGHGLVKASSVMGATCKGGECPDDEGDGEGDGVGTGDGDGDGSTADEGDGEEGKKKTAIASPAPAAVVGSEAEGTKKILAAVEKVGDEVGTLRGAVKSLGDRVETIEKLPAPIGRPPARPVEKVLGPGGETVNAVDEAAILKRYADAEEDPERKRVLTLVSVEASIKAAHKAAGR